MAVHVINKIGNETKQAFELNNMELHMPFRRSIFYINNTEQDVVVMHRNNLPITVRKASSGVINVKDFIVRVIYKFNGSAGIVDTINMINEQQKLNGTSNSELNIIKDVLTETFNSTRSIHNCEIVIDSNINMKEIGKLDVSYNSNLDLLFMYKGYRPNIHHPYSTEGRGLQQLKDMNVDTNQSGLLVELVDNEGKYNKRFMSIGKMLMEIGPKEDVNRESGIYVTEIKNKDGHNSTSNRFLSVEDAQDAYGIYPTVEEATTSGQVEHYGKQQLNMAQIQLEKLKTENSLALEKKNYETELLKKATQAKDLENSIIMNEMQTMQIEHKRLLAELEIANKVKKIEYERVKDSSDTDYLILENMIKKNSRQRDDYYESRSAERKDKSEYLKLGAAGLVTGLGVYAAMKKFS